MRRLIPLSIFTVLMAAPAFAQDSPLQVPPGSRTPSAPATAVTPAPMPPQTARPPAQAPPAPTGTPRASTPRAPFIGGQNMPAMPASTNIRLELVITDTFTGTPVKKAVSLLVLTGNSGMIRTTNVGRSGPANLDVDAVVQAYENGMVSTRITFQYQPATPTDGALAGTRPPTLNESITVALMDGKPMTISQSADPATDRKVTAELTATILK